MKTVSVYVMNLCVPCENRCRYCLLSYDGKESGIDYKRSERYAKRFYDWLKENRPELSFVFGFGYSMEHPELLSAIKFCQSVESVTGEFLQFDGMKFRNEEELNQLLSDLKSVGIKLIDLTLYGTEEYHDRFAARKGDFRLMLNTLKQANKIDLDVAISIPLTHENVDQVDKLLEQLDDFRTTRISCFVPHSEGRGQLLDSVRFSLEDYERLSNKAKTFFNRDRFKTEQEWLNTVNLSKPEQRMVALTLTPDNIDFFEKQGFEETISYLENLDNEYYNVVPDFEELKKIYGNSSGEKMYSARDLYLCYQRQYITEHNLDLYDVNDERQCFSRRF